MTEPEEVRAAMHALVDQAVDETMRSGGHVLVAFTRLYLEWHERAERAERRGAASLGDRLGELIRLGETRGAVFYEMVSRRAGWAVCWWEPARERGDEWRTGVVTYNYYPTPEAAIRGETARLLTLPEEVKRG